MKKRLSGDCLADQTPLSIEAVRASPIWGWSPLTKSLARLTRLAWEKPFAFARAVQQVFDIKGYFYFAPHTI